MVEIPGSMRSINNRMRIHRRSIPRALQIDVTQRQIRSRRHCPRCRRLRFQHQLLRNILMPLHHIRIRLTWQALFGQYARKRRAISWVCEIEALYRLLQERHVLFGLQQQLDRLPSYKPRRRQSWYCRWVVGIFFGLQGVVAAEGLVDVGKRGL